MEKYRTIEVVTDDNNRDKDNNETGYRQPRYYQKIEPRNEDKNQNRLGANTDYQRNDNYVPRRYDEASPQPNRSTNYDKRDAGDNRGSIPPYTSQDDYRQVPNYKTVKVIQEPSPYTSNNNRYNTLNDASKTNNYDYNDSVNQPKKDTRRKVLNKYNNRYDDDNYDNRQNIEITQNDFDINSIDGTGDKYPIKYARSPEPRIPSKQANDLSNKYRFDENKIRYPERNRNKDQNMSRSRKKNQDKSKDDKIDELLKIIDELNSNIDDKKQQIRNLKIDNIKKDKEINELSNELENLQKDIEDKKLEQEKEINDILKNNNDNEEDMPKLKNAYTNLLKDMDNMARENDEIKYNYNKLIDDYNDLKKSNDSKALDDYNKLQNDLDRVKNENDRLKRDYE